MPTKKKSKPCPNGRPTEYKPEYCQQKICSRCKKTKLKTEFGKESRAKDGLRSECRDCRTKEYRQINPIDSKRATPREHSLVDGVELKRCPTCKKWLVLDKFGLCRRTGDGLQPRCKTCEQIYRDTHKLEIKKRIKKWAIKNPERLKKSGEKWKKANPEKVREINKRSNQKRLSTSKGALAKRMSDSVYKALKGNKDGKCTFDILDYTVKDLKKHLQKTMPIGFVWGDYIAGRLHVDHKIPVSVFNFEKPEDDDFKKCFALKNLQLLPAFDNMSKSDKLTRHFQPSLVF